MQFSYNTNRLTLKSLATEDARPVLEFYVNNKDIFEPWEPLHDNNFYSLDYQLNNLEAEMKLFLRQQSIRYYLFKKYNGNKVIGTISFTDIKNSPANCCKIGYRIDKDHQGQGYASEALLYIIPMIMNELHIYRIEADVMINNHPSIKLLRSLGFIYEGIARESYEINGIRTDHARYSLLYTDVF